MANEREILTEFIELYRSYPCLWNMVSEEYKDKTKKTEAWEALMNKLKQLEPEANIATAKKKIEHMRTAYNREAKKVNNSKRLRSKANDVHVPNLWYFKLLSFVSKNNERKCRSDSDPLASDDDDDIQNREQSRAETSSKIRKKHTSDCFVNQKKLKLIEPAQKQLELEQHNISKPTNSFGIYVGEQLDQVSTFQRQVAEKLIAEVIFLAKTENLRFDSKIETPSSSHSSLPFSNSYRQPTSPPPLYHPPSSSPLLRPEVESPSFQYIQLRVSSPSLEETNENSNERKASIETNDDSNETKISIESSSSSLLKQLLTLKKAE